MTMERILLLAFPLSLLAQTGALDLNTIQRIKMESFRNSEVMEYAFFLTDVYGPRLLGSPNFRRPEIGQWINFGFSGSRTFIRRNFLRSAELGRLSILRLAYSNRPMLL